MVAGVCAGAGRAGGGGVGARLNSAAIDVISQFLINEETEET
jgi:hypothetical protein